MADFHKAFEAIDEDGSGEITVDELQHYMIKNNYKETFVSKWLKLFDDDDCGKITYRHYCDTLGLVPKDRVTTCKENKEEAASMKEEEIIEMSVSKKESAAVSTKSKSEKKKDNKMDVDATSIKTTENANIKEDKIKGRRPKSYPIQVNKKSPRHRKSLFSNHVRRLRSSIQPGVILILLAGRHRGKRVVFLNQLSSGLLLVTGPFKVNGCPLRRVHQKMVIATKSKVDISEVKIPDNINDVYFARDTKDKKEKSADVSTIFAKTKKTYALKNERKKDQKEVDGQVMKAIKSRDDKLVLLKYLKSLFSLSSHDCPHKMVF